MESLHSTSHYGFENSTILAVNRSASNPSKQYKKYDEEIEFPEIGNSSILILSIIFALALTLMTIPWFNTAFAQQSYQYNPQHSFYSTWFMKSKMPVVTHEQTQQYCNQGCHWTYFPGLLPQQSWDHLIDDLDNHFGKTISLDPKVKEDIRQYLKKNAAEHSENKLSVKIMDSLNLQTPLKVTDVPYIKKQHEDLKPDTFRRHAVKTLSSCPACHKQLEQTGNFD